MRLLYLCSVDPPPPPTDYDYVREFFKSLPEYLQPSNRENNAPHMLYFADRIGTNWFPEFHDFAVVFLSERLLTNEIAISCLNRAKSAFPNMVGIDLYNNLTPELTEKAKTYTKRIFSLDAGKEFLISTFPEIAAAFDIETKELTESIETDGYKYLEDTICDLNKHCTRNKWISFGCYISSFVVLAAMLVFTFWRFCIINPLGDPINIQNTIVLCVEVIVLSALDISLSRFLFMLGKSFMVESIRCADRAHAIGLGRLYLKLYKSKFKWDELRDVLQNWNIDHGSAFINLDAKDLEAVNIEKMISSLKH